MNYQLIPKNQSHFLQYFFSRLLVITTGVLFSACSVSKQISKQATTILLEDSAVSAGHIGISIYEPATNQYWYNYNATKYFVPASNTKLFSLYAGMKYLGDSLPGLRYQDSNDTAINIFPTGDPSFLLSSYKNQPVLDFLKQQRKSIHIAKLIRPGDNPVPLGSGWAWDDYNEDYAPERNPFPVYGNLATFKVEKITVINAYSVDLQWNISPRYFKKYIDSFYLQPANLRVALPHDSISANGKNAPFTIVRKKDVNSFLLSPSGSEFSKQEIPFITDGVATTVEILKNDFNLDIKTGAPGADSLHPEIPNRYLAWHTIHSQPVDSLFTPMMHNSDNFFAEQTLLMVCNERFGSMSDEKIIDTLLNNELKDIPQRPNWVDGSGLSRYNLFTPQSFVYILNKLKNEFGLERLKHILPTGGTGTITNYYKKDAGFIFAKTGTLSNHVALSGFLITKKNKLLIFSVLVNNYQSGATPVRKAIEKFIGGIREKY